MPPHRPWRRATRAAGTPTPGVPPRRRLACVALALAVTLLAAAAANAALDLTQVTGGWSRTVGGPLTDRPGVFALSSAVVWLVLVGLVLLTGRVLLGVGLLGVAVAVLAFANHQKLSLRREPVYPSDLAFLRELGFLRQMVAPGTLVWLCLGLAAGVAACLAVGRLVRRRFPRIRRETEPRAWAWWTAGRVAGLVVVALGLGQLSGFNDDGNAVRRGYVAADVDWATHSQRTNFLRNGVVAGMLYNLDVPAMEEPPGYSEATMRAVAQRWSAVAERENRRRSSSLDGVNVVMVLSEAFSDPTRVPGVTLERDPIPRTRALMGSTTSGSMLTQLVGAGTANMEFEALTGLSLAQFLPQMTTPYQMLVPGRESFPSVVELLTSAGHGAVAVHPYGPRMYHRDTVYPTLGFDRFVYDDLMRDRSRIEDNDLISDDAAYAEVAAQLAESEDPLLVQLVTMQNHYPMAGKYADPLEVGGVDDDTVDQLGGYARGLEYSDRALRRFLTGLERSGEETAVVFYGDHTPAFWASDSAVDRDETALRQTPFFLWSTHVDLPARDLGVTSPIYFLPLLYDALDVPQPPFYALLQRLHRAIPAMEQGLFHTEGRFSPTPTGLSPADRRVLRDYRLVQYDLTTGSGWAQDELLDPRP